jgi:RimJ/RimL family protein N-acetyltransferase
MLEYTFYDINLEFKTLLLGFTWYGKQFRGTGLNKHCKYLLLQFAFETLGWSV